MGDLAADMHVDAGDLDAGQAVGALIYLAGALPGNTEFVFRFSGRDLGMGLCIHIRIDPQGNARLFAKLCCDLAQMLKLGLGFDIEAENVLFQRKGQLAAGFAYAERRGFWKRECLRPERAAFPPSETTSAPAPRRASTFRTA